MNDARRVHQCHQRQREQRAQPARPARGRPVVLPPLRQRPRGRGVRLHAGALRLGRSTTPSPWRTRSSAPASGSSRSSRCGPTRCIPTVAAKALATLDQFSDGRAVVHFISGGSDAEQAREGDYLTKDAALRAHRRVHRHPAPVWSATEPFSHEGEHYRFEDFVSAVRPVNGTIPVSVGGSSAEAYQVGGSRGDIFGLWGEPLADTRQQIDSVHAAGRARRPHRPTADLGQLPPDHRRDRGAGLGEGPPHARRARAAAVAGTRPGVRPLGGATPPNVGSQRLLEIAARQDVHDRALWTPTASATGAAGASTALVGTPETVAAAILDYVDLGADLISIRGYDNLNDLIDYGRHVLPAGAPGARPPRGHRPARHPPGRPPGRPRHRRKDLRMTTAPTFDGPIPDTAARTVEFISLSHLNPSTELEPVPTRGIDLTYFRRYVAVARGRRLRLHAAAVRLRQRRLVRRRQRRRPADRADQADRRAAARTRRSRPSARRSSPPSTSSPRAARSSTSSPAAATPSRPARATTCPRTAATPGPRSTSTSCVARGPSRRAFSHDGEFYKFDDFGPGLRAVRRRRSRSRSAASPTRRSQVGGEQGRHLQLLGRAAGRHLRSEIDRVHDIARAAGRTDAAADLGDVPPDHRRRPTSWPGQKAHDYVEKIEQTFQAAASTSATCSTGAPQNVGSQRALAFAAAVRRSTTGRCGPGPRPSTNAAGASTALVGTPGDGRRRDPRLRRPRRRPGLDPRLRHPRRRRRLRPLRAAARPAGARPPRGHRPARHAAGRAPRATTTRLRAASPPDRCRVTQRRTGSRRPVRRARPLRRGAGRGHRRDRRDRRRVRPHRRRARGAVCRSRTAPGC